MQDRGHHVCNMRRICYNHEAEGVRGGDKGNAPSPQKKNLENLTKIFRKWGNAQFCPHH